MNGRPVKARVAWTSSMLAAVAQHQHAFATADAEHIDELVIRFPGGVLSDMESEELAEIGDQRTKIATLIELLKKRPRGYAALVTALRSTNFQFFVNVEELIVSQLARHICEARTRVLLLEFLQSTGGGEWNNRTKIDADSSGIWAGDISPEDFTKWFGVATERELGADCVVALDLRRNNLRGTLPQSIGELGELRRLDLEFNDVDGELPPKLLAGLPRLEALNLRRNRLAGGLPVEVGAMTALTRLVLAENRIGGPLPAALGRCQALEELSIQDNCFEGEFPAVVCAHLGHCLKTLVAFRNCFAGPLPESLKMLTSLVTLDLFGNRFSGPIPPGVAKCKRLERLNLASNALEGPIPEKIGKLKRLRFLQLNANRLDGPVPESLSRCRGLQELDLSGNALTGVLPAFMGKMARLQHFDCSHNALGGAVPAGFGGCPELQFLGLARNHFGGRLPSDLLGLRKLKMLKVGSNDFKELGEFEDAVQKALPEIILERQALA